MSQDEKVCAVQNMANAEGGRGPIDPSRYVVGKGDQRLHANRVDDRILVPDSRTPDIEPSENVRFFLRSPRERRSADATVSLERPLPSGSVLRRELRWHEYDALNSA